VGQARIVIDVLPVDVTKLQAQAQRLRRLMQLGVAAAVIVFVLLGVFGAQVLMASVERKQLYAELRRLIPAEERVRQLEERNEVLRVAVDDMAELTETRTSWSRVFQTIADCMGDEVWIKKVSVNKRNQMTLDAGAMGVNELIDFKNAMDGSARFENVEVGNETRQQQGNVVFRQFRLTCNVLPDYRYYDRLRALKDQLTSALRTAPPTAPAQAGAEDAPPAPVAAPEPEVASTSSPVSAVSNAAEEAPAPAEEAQ
jgi:Tfp pilus assembly protein PilN